VILDADACFRALRARDVRFDGMFYVGVTSTGVYCRPICPARTPAESRCRFFTVAAEAERAGFRACLRCRPERAPGTAAVDAVPHLVRAAARRIDAGYLDDHSVEQLADRLGVTARHLRRSLETELGVSPVELAQSRRLALARQLLVDGTLPITEVAHAAGFASLRRFHAVFRAAYGRPPTALRRATGRARVRGWTAAGARANDAAAASDAIAELRLDYRPPLAWEPLIGFLAARAIPGVETVEDGVYRRTVAIGDRVGWIEVRRGADGRSVRARVARSLTGRLPAIAARVRAVFDLDARPDIVDAHLAADAALRAGLCARPGLRLPGAFDGAELAIRAVLGQQISVAAATTLARRLCEALGAPVEGAPAGLDRLFPTPAAIARAGAERIRALGLPAARAQAIAGLARALDHDTIDLAPGADPEQAANALAELPGLGPWTASYIAMRALSWPDAFLGGDLVVRRALGVTTARAAEERAERWRPWRAYGVMHLWMGGP
jgi:AraC family transcriptional regulator of adaptative response / DNA-3-methyladenine glycosylase II